MQFSHQFDRNKQKGYTFKVKLEALQRIELVGVAQVARELQFPHSTVDGWWQQRGKLRAFRGNKLSKTVKGQGRRELFPYTPALVTFMKDTRREEDWLTTSRMIGFMQIHFTEWLIGYLRCKKSEESGRRALERLCQRTAAQYGFSTQKHQETKLPTEELLQLQARFAFDFWSTYSSCSDAEIYNVDETAINFDMPPARIWAVKGRNGSAKVIDYSKHSGRMTAVLTIRGDRKKLPILFILRGKLGGTIDSNELKDLPPGHFYTVQEHGWMDSIGWSFYVKSLLKFEIDNPALLLVDNFDSHVSDEGVRIVAEEACATVVPLPPKSTSVCQPLVVGVMGSLKARIRGNFICQSGLAAKEKRLRAVKATIAAWDSLPFEVIKSSFTKAIPKIEEAIV